MGKKNLDILRDIGIMLGMVALATICGAVFFSVGGSVTNVVVIYLLFVVLTARYTSGYMAGILAAITSMLAFNWFFIEPLFTLKVYDGSYIVTFILMTLTALFTSALTTKFMKAAEEAKRKEDESNALYQMTNHLSDAKDVVEISKVVIRTVSAILGCNVGCIYFDEFGQAGTTFIQQKSDGNFVRRELNNGNELQWKMENLHTTYDMGEEFCDWPIYGSSATLGIVRIPVEAMQSMGEKQKKLILAVLENSALALERYRSIFEEEKSRREIERERYRSNLLRAISHDIRTPLTGIMGSSEMLMNVLEKGEFPYEMAEGIYKDADWLHSLVENILNLTRLQDGDVPLTKQPEAVEEIVGAAITAMEKRVPGREIQVELPDNLMIVPMNARLIHQVLINLMDNAVVHSEDDTPIKVSVALDKKDNMARFTVSDHGTGIPEADLDRVFEMFYTTNRKSADSRRGVGLGLAICQSIVEAHGGKIFARNRLDDHGAEFIFTLPLGGEAE